jgi:hypothetical protein
MAHRKRNRVSGAVLIMEAGEVYQAVIETCVRLANCRAEAVSDLELALPKLEKLRSALSTRDGPTARRAAPSSSLATVAFICVAATTTSTRSSVSASYRKGLRPVHKCVD